MLAAAVVFSLYATITGMTLLLGVLGVATSAVLVLFMGWFFGTPKIRGALWQFFPTVPGWLGAEPPSGPLSRTGRIRADLAQVGALEVKEFGQVSLDCWHALGFAFATSGIHDLPIDFDSLTPTVRSAYWPDSNPRKADPDRSLATAYLRDFTRRVYTLDGKGVIRDLAGVQKIDGMRHTMMQAVRRWQTRLEGDDGVGVAEWLRENLGEHYSNTMKLLWWLEAAKSESVRNKDPDYRPLVAMRAALKSV